MRKMKYAKRQLTRVFLTVITFSIITTFILVISSSEDHTCFVSVPDKSFNSIDESLLDFISSSNILITNLEDALKDELAQVSEYSQFIIKDVKQIQETIHTMEQHLDERKFQLLLSLPIINDHNFTFTHNPIGTCTNSLTNILLVVPSATTHFKNRTTIRNGRRGDFTRDAQNKAKMLFFLGRPQTGTDSTIQQKIDMEAQQYGDIVQENFEDIYKNNRLKSVSMLKWASTYCSNAKYIIRSDDDIAVNVSATVSVLYRTSEKLTNFMFGRRLINDTPSRVSRNKYYLSTEEYPSPVLPPYLLGGLQGYPISTARRLYEAALRVKPIWLEDVYITGICARRVHVPILTDPAYIFEHPVPVP